MEQELELRLADAKAAFNTGDMPQARELFLTVLDDHPESTIALYAVGTIDFQANNFQSALEHFDRAAKLEPEAVDIAFNYAACLATVGERIGALVQLQRATQYCRDDPVFCSKIAEMSIKLGEPAAAVSMLSRLKVLPPKDQILLADAQVSLGNWREAVNILERLHKEVNTNPVVAEKLAVAAGKLRDYPTAISAYERYMQLVTPDANDYLRFADLLLLAQDTKRCSQVLKVSESMGEDSVGLHILRAQVERLRGNYAAVQDAINQALVRQANHGQAWMMQAELATEEQLDGFIGDLQDELKKEDEVKQLSPHFQALLYYALADMQDRKGDYGGASNALSLANQIQYANLREFNRHYNKEATEQQFGRLMEDFHHGVFDLDNAIIPANETEIKPIFIVGMPRSGTTLVERILGQNEHVFCAGELEAMEFVAAQFRQLAATGKLAEPEKIGAKKWTELRQAYLEKLPEISKPVFTDKLPHNFCHVGLILKLFPEAKIIQMNRSKNDVCLSIFSNAFSAGHNYANNWEDIDHFYTQGERLMTHWSSLNSPRILDLNYEDLVADPEVYGKRLVEFCGFEWNESYLDFHESVSQSFTFSEMQVRKPVSQRRVGRWKAYAEHIPELG